MPDKRSPRASFRSFETCVCGGILLPDSKFCRYCGAPVEGAEVEDAATPTEPGSTLKDPAGDGVVTAQPADSAPSAAARASLAPANLAPANLAPTNVAGANLATDGVVLADSAASAPHAASPAHPAGDGVAPASPIVATETNAAPAAESPAVPVEPHAEIEPPIVTEFDFEEADRLESRSQWFRTIPGAIAVVGFILLLLWARGRKTQPDLPVTVPTAQRTVAPNDASAQNGANIASSDTNSTDSGAAVVISNAPTPRPGASNSSAQSPRIPAPRLPSGGLALPPPAPLPQDAQVTTDDLDSGGASSGGGPYDPNALKTKPATVPGGASIAHSRAGDFREDQIVGEIRHVTTQLTLNVGDPAVLHQRRANLYMQQLDNSSAAADYNAAISIYTDRIQRGDRVDASKAGIAACQRGIQQLH